MKTRPTGISVESYLDTVSGKRREEARALIAMMQEISGDEPYMWGPGIIGFGTQHYVYQTGREGDMPRLAFSPRKASITIYFSEGFDRYSDALKRLGKYRQSVSCLYVNQLADIHTDTLREMLESSYALAARPPAKPANVEEYIASVPVASRRRFDELRQLIREVLPAAEEVLSYGIIGYKIDDRRARVYISGWKDHVAVYPVPKDKDLQAELAPYIKGKGTLWFELEEPLPKALIRTTVKALAS